MLQRIDIINVTNVYIMLIIPRIVCIKKEVITTMLKKMRGKPTILKMMTNNMMYFIIACLR